MSQAIGNPEELDRFAQSLSHFLETLNEVKNGLNQDFATLGDSWRDEKRLKFEEDYTLLLQNLAEFENSASEQIPYLHTLASRLRDYLGS